MDWILLAVIGYLVGSLPSGFLLSRFSSGIDLRAFGSGSTGATNVLRSGDKKMALFTLLIDAAKGAVLAGSTNVFSDSISAFVACFFCVLGHIYPVWLRFKGGKGVATAAGIFLVFSPCITLISIGLWGLTAKIFMVSSVASMVFIVSYIVMVAYEFIFKGAEFQYLLFSGSVALLILYAHFSNIKRLIHGEEKALHGNEDQG
ncbi:MAG: glycerol-3-phosphate 1-O-acyltransferase PlsY [Holosporales bacterium]|jgi:glycerol-3-phosphate acyltransferase PlsY|nr:glycerol-3-phosphate 1-O-acyltransferase PlsY [Holosporales bacterium]